ncbi:hypothetical protein J6TS1_03840 [Siminovitchia terrae]|uniref:Uncharacterized protein n=1 Tax=Siminovitchia terrae TaxID=1914933 RepID=A0A429X659_SIMTE|nr:hypothetical protein [Siminovitchia terrae]RST58753.1 hypothetical protein D5F11_016065 [Siminovitchia terrae]GIN89965.1 hypothetical protein J22TS1_10160 [Siminovitchia terrae]GIN94514.1 hypothetical protein J6TS1_03840 [Siminovitchia terrae]
MRKNKDYEAVFLPSKSGVIKIYIYGFKPYGSWGEVHTSMNGVSVSVRGYNRKKTIIRSLKKLNESLLNIKEDQ